MGNRLPVMSVLFRGSEDKTYDEWPNSWLVIGQNQQEQRTRATCLLFVDVGGSEGLGT